MNTDTDNPVYTNLKKRFALPLAIILVSCVLLLAYTLCEGQYSLKKKELLITQEEALQVWVSGTVEAASLWTKALDTQAKRLSSAELYRLFASEIGQMDSKTAAMINEPDGNTHGLSEDASMLVEQVPLMRNVMLDFMNYNGLLDARIVNNAGQTLISSLARPSPVTENQLKIVQQSIAQEKVIFAPVRSSPAGLCMDYADPVLAINTLDAKSTPVAGLLLTAPVTGQVAQFLARSIHQGEQAFPFIVQKNGTVFERIMVQSPTPVPMQEKLALNTQNALPFAPRTSLAGEMQVYSLGTKVPELDWWVVLEMPATEIDAKLKAQAIQIYGLGLLASVGIILFLALMWWVVIGRQQRLIAERFQSLYTVIQRQKRLLDSINISIGTGLVMATTKGEVLACNPAFAEIVHSTDDKIVGSSLLNLFDPSFATYLLEQIRQVSQSEETAFFERAIMENAEERLFRVTLYPFEDNNSNQDEKSVGAVAIFQDITTFRRNSEKRRLQQLSTINALVQAVEGVDPFLAGHTHMMVNLVELMSRSMNLEEVDRNTLRTAANLSQIGRLFVPRELFSKSEKLTPEEQQEVMRVPEHAYNVLQHIDFGMPVPQAIYQMYENIDGTGHPLHLKGEQISLPARVLAVVNAFSALVSPRSYRLGLPIEKALSILQSQETHYDQKIVAELVKILQSPEGAQAATVRIHEK